MNTTQSRINVLIDIFELSTQPAQILPTLLPGEFVTAVLQEFRGELPYLSDCPDDYRLVRVSDGVALDETRPIARQLGGKAHLTLTEHQGTPPAGARPVVGHAYLRHAESGVVYPLHWQPAIIGRSDRSLADNEHLAVNLTTYPTGLRVSRRHARIMEEGGQYSIERLADNPTTVEARDGRSVSLGTTPHPLRHGDQIRLDHSAIQLIFVERKHDGAM